MAYNKRPIVVYQYEKQEEVEINNAVIESIVICLYVEKLTGVVQCGQNSPVLAAKQIFLKKYVKYIWWFQLFFVPLPRNMYIYYI